MKPMKPYTYEIEAVRKLARAHASAYAVLTNMIVRWKQDECDRLIAEDEPQAMLRHQGHVRALQEALKVLALPYDADAPDNSSAERAPHTLI